MPGSTCPGYIDLRFPTGWPSWSPGGPHGGGRWVYTYKCPLCGREVRVVGSSFEGRHPTPSRGMIACPHYLEQEEVTNG